MGVSVDHVPALLAWAESLGGISFPLLSDFWPHGEVARSYGAFREAEGVAERAIFVIDAEGTVRYCDIHAIDQQPDNDVLLREVEKVAVSRPPAERQQPVASSAEEADEALVMYCRSWCGDCRRAKAWLQANHIEYREVDIERESGAADRVRELAGKIVTPTFKMRDEVIVNFDEARLRGLLLP